MARARRKEPTEPATLSIPRQNVKATLAVSCPKCQHKAFIEVDQWPDDMPVALFGSIMECSKCGTVGADVRPAWKKRAR
jgi:C4-type Zn-finger protein